MGEAARLLWLYSNAPVLALSVPCVAAAAQSLVGQLCTLACIPTVDTLQSCNNMLLCCATTCACMVQVHAVSAAKERSCSLAHIDAVHTL